MVEQPRSFTLPFVKKEQLAKDTFTFYFDRTVEKFDFFPGQYVRLTIPHESADERGESRFFSLTTSPQNKEYITITTKFGEPSSSFKRTLTNLISGKEVKFFGPNGNFILRAEEQVPHILLAGGIGITPYHSMLTYAAENNLTIPLYLFVSFSTVEEVIWYKDFQELAKKNNRYIQPIYTITQYKESKTVWYGETGRISMNLIKKYVPDVHNTLFYIVGPQKMVAAMDEVVKAEGILPERIRKENFIGY